MEGLVTPGHALYKGMELFQDMNSDAAMSDTDVISFHDDTYPGSDEGDPVALSNATADPAADQKAKPTSGKVLSEYPPDTGNSFRWTRFKFHETRSVNLYFQWVTDPEIIQFSSFSIPLQITKEYNPPGYQ